MISDHIQVYVTSSPVISMDWTPIVMAEGISKVAGAIKETYNEIKSGAAFSEGYMRTLAFSLEKRLTKIQEQDFMTLFKYEIKENPKSPFDLPSMTVTYAPNSTARAVMVIAGTNIYVDKRYEYYLSTKERTPT